MTTLTTTTIDYHGIDFVVQYYLCGGHVALTAAGTHEVVVPEEYPSADIRKVMLWGDDVTSKVPEKIFRAIKFDLEAVL